MPPKLALKPQTGVAGPSTLSTSRQEERPTIKTTKEWIVPPRPKPGRKPAQVDPESSRKALNRASQRAFRERRQEYVGELEEKVRLLEQGEGEKSVFFQQQAQSAKQETTALRVENAALRRIVAELRAELGEHKRVCGGGSGADNGKRRSVPTDDADAPAKRLRRSSVRPAAAKAPAAYVEHSLSDDEMDQVTPSAVVSPMADQGESPGEPCCGLCSADGSCFCADVGYNIDRSSHQHAVPSRIIKVEVAPDFETSQIAVPLRLRKTPGRTPVWLIESAATASDQPALCNGDPTNCPACQNDPFGKAFCNALSESVCSSNPCATCPSNHASTSTLSTVPVITARAATPPPPDSMDDQSLFAALADLPCCGDPGLCGSLSCAPKLSPSPGLAELAESETILPRSVDPGVRTSDTVPCNEAWTVLKCHPNIAFANLQMLADVVAKRTRCDGPVNMSSSSSLAVPSLSTPSRVRTPPLGLPRLPDLDFRAPALVAHEALVCAADAGQRKRLTVERGAVNEALEYLDRAVGRGGPLLR